MRTKTTNLRNTYLKIAWTYCAVKQANNNKRRREQLKKVTGRVRNRVQEENQTKESNRKKHKGRVQDQSAEREGNPYSDVNTLVGLQAKCGSINILRHCFPFHPAAAFGHSGVTSWYTPLAPSHWSPSYQVLYPSKQARMNFIQRVKWGSGSMRIILWKILIQPCI